MQKDFATDPELARTPSYLSAVLHNKCPRCRRGDLFESRHAYDLRKNHFMKMHDHCPVCGQPTEIELGFYYGTSYVSYALGVGLAVAVFVVWKILFGISFMDNSIFWYLGTMIAIIILLQPVFMRLARTLWLSCYVKYNPNWRTEKPEHYERLNDDMKNAW